jgi:chromosome partitioning protein
MAVIDLSTRIAALRERAARELAGRIITVFSGKGGVGKTLLAMELAWLLDGVLVDLDWDGGRASVALGQPHTKYVRAPLLDALATGRTPVPKRLKKRPDLVPGHPDFLYHQPRPEVLAEHLSRWAQEWQRPVIVDTHPGGSDSSFGALAAADVVLHPVELATRVLDALEATLEEIEQYPLLLIPNEVPTYVPEYELNRLADLAKRHEVQVGPIISNHSWYRTRRLRTVVSSATVLGQRSGVLTEQLVRVGERTVSYATAA